MEDEAIVQLYLTRDEAAIRQTAEKYGARLRALCLGVTADAQTAEECENDTYLQAWNRIPPSEPRTYFYAFLARIARHLSIDRCRERASLKRGACLVELSGELETCLPSDGDVERELDERELAAVIDRYLGTLSREKRVIFVRRYFYLDSVAEIADRCAVSESSVKSSLFRARNGLRAYLIKEGYTP